MTGPQDTPQDTPEDTPRDTPRNVPQDSPLDAGRGTTTGTADGAHTFEVGAPITLAVTLEFGTVRVHAQDTGTVTARINPARSTRRVDLPGLSPDGVRRLAAGTPHLPEDLHRVTGGNPFFLTEVLASDGGDLPSTVRDAVLGRPGFVHGGALAGLLEFAGYAAVRRAVGDDAAELKPIGVSIDFLRGAGARDTLAVGVVRRLGKRVANVEATAWQDDEARPVATARMNVLLRRP